MIKIHEGAKVRSTALGNKENPTYDGATIHTYQDSKTGQFYLKCTNGYVSGWFPNSYLDKRALHWFDQVVKKPVVII